MSNLLQIGDMPVICGGMLDKDTYLDTCLQFTPDKGWVEFPSMMYERGMSGGVNIDEDRMWITGK